MIQCCCFQDVSNLSELDESAILGDDDIQEEGSVNDEIVEHNEEAEELDYDEDLEAEKAPRSSKFTSERVRLDYFAIIPILILRENIALKFKRREEAVCLIMALTFLFQALIQRRSLLNEVSSKREEQNQNAPTNNISAGKSVIFYVLTILL